MHKETNKVLRLSAIFRKGTSERENPLRESVQSEVKSDHEIKAIITELQAEKLDSNHRRMSAANSDVKSATQSRMTRLYQASYSKKEKME